MKKYAKVLKIVCALLLIGASVVSFVASSEYYYDGGYTSYEYYGGDAYTGIQQACADAANNVDRLGGYISAVMQFFFIILGIAFAAAALFVLASAFADAASAAPVAEPRTAFAEPVAEEEAESEA